MITLLMYFLGVVALIVVKCVSGVKRAFLRFYLDNHSLNSMFNKIVINRLYLIGARRKMHWSEALFKSYLLT